jgi:hypothetical protein
MEHAKTNTIIVNFSLAIVTCQNKEATPVLVVVTAPPEPLTPDPRISVLTHDAPIDEMG